MPGYLPPVALYVHVPLCRSRCAYCDFHSLAAAGWSPAALEGLVASILRRVDSLVRRFPGESPPRTIYVGGGTPSALPRPLLSALLDGLARLVPSALEWTMEANPESLDEEALDIAEAAGVNRISIGVQSLDDRLLERLGRPASAAEAMDAVSRAVARPGLRVSADLISGLPRGISLAKEVGILLEAGIGHLSVYDLSLEEGTKLAREVASGSFVLPDPDEACEERLEAGTVLEAAGFRRYEVSNHALPGQESLHNLAYWHLDSYIGAGPGAVSTLIGRPEEDGRPGTLGVSLRIEEGRARPGQAAAPATESLVSAEDSAFEAIMMAYRTIYGLDEGTFVYRMGLPSRSLIGKTLASWAARLVPATAWPAPFTMPGPASFAAAGQALDAQGLDLLNRFLVDCLSELEASFPRKGN